jgi:stage II sporulation protein AA (anti-sigma F factor antagonist)
MSPTSPICPVRVREVGETTVVQFTGRGVLLDETNAPAVGDELLAVVQRQRPRTLVVDFENVAFLSSTTLGLLLVLRKEMQAWGGRLVLCHLAPQVYGVFEATRLHLLLDVRRKGQDSSAGQRN